MELLNFEIQEDEFIKLKQGETIDKHWHVDPLNPDYCLCVFVGKKTFFEKDFFDVLKKGHGVAPITLNDQEIDRLQHSDDAFTFPYANFEILLISHRFRELKEEELQKEREG